MLIFEGCRSANSFWGSEGSKARTPDESEEFLGKRLDGLVVMIIIIIIQHTHILQSLTEKCQRLCFFSDDRSTSYRRQYSRLQSNRLQ